ncbi:hypothetical protein [Dactylosporangium sp. CA-092794]|uniref:hypothetical protein n=1 Tax=Dactylosporangium sp. CA-092794 TaxID=3239929 RepID=UPI003D8DF821
MTRLGIDAPRFDRFRPDLEGIECLDLNWGHAVNEEPRNFGLGFVNSIGNTGHRWVAACVIPGLPPERYPIAMADEEGPTIDVFASSIETWLPCYLIRFAEAQARWGGLDALRAEEPALREALAAFPGDVLTPLLSERPPSRAELYAIAEPGGAVAAYERLAAEDGDWAGLIRQYPSFNQPLFDRFDRQPSAELAGEVLRRRIMQGGDGTAKRLERAAATLRDSGVEPAEPVAPLFPLAEDEYELAEAYFATGERWEAAGDPAQALVWYENAINEYGFEEEWHEGAVARIRALTADDPDYVYYLKDFVHC